MTTADRLSARTVHTNPEHEDPHKDPKRTETSTVRGKPGRQRARRRHARCFPRPAARSVPTTHRPQDPRCVTQPRLRLPRLHLCVPQLRLCSQPRNETCLPRLFRLAEPLLWLPHSHLGPQSHLRSQHRLCEPQRYMSASTSVRSPASAVPGKPWHRGPVPVSVTPRRAGSALSSGSVEHHLCRGMR